MKAEESAEILKEVEEIVKRREAREEERDIKTPLAKVDTIKENRTPRGTGASIMFGVPFDVFDLEDILIRVSPTDLRTMLRLENVRVAEQMRNSPRLSQEKKSDFNWSILLWILIIAAIGIAAVFLLPRILNALGGFIP